MRAKWRKLLLGLLVLLLLLSLGLNFYLYNWGLRTYREMKSVRLDPISQGRFEDANAGLEVVPAGKLRLVLAGDSTVEVWDPPPAPAGWQVVNRGVGGETTSQFRLRFERDVLRLAPAAVVLATGHNDLNSLGVLPGREEEIVADCEKNLRALVEQLRERQIPVVLVTLIPLLPNEEWSRFPVWSSAIPSAYGRVTETLRGLSGPGVIVLDAVPKLAIGGRLNPEFARSRIDGHLNAAGYEILNKAVVPLLDTAVKDRPPVRGFPGQSRTPTR